MKDMISRKRSFRTKKDKIEEEMQAIPEAPESLTPNQRVMRFTLLREAETGPRAGTILEYCFEQLDHKEKMADLEFEIWSARDKVAKLEVERYRVHFRNSLRGLEVLSPSTESSSEKVILWQIFDRIKSMKNPDDEGEWNLIKQSFKNDESTLSRLRHSKILPFVTKSRHIIENLIVAIENKDALTADGPGKQTDKNDVEAVKESFKNRM